MNAIVSLCHFCELHGPKVLFCTQPLHPEEESTGGDSDAEGGAMKTLVSPALSESQTPTSFKSLPNYKNDLCEGCTSVHLGFVSHDDEAGVSYVSSQRPQQSRRPQNRDVFSMIRQACIRSLSCEVCPGSEGGPIFFGDDQQGNTISFTFHIKDNQARGLQRLYSIIVVMMDKIYLLNSWPFLVSNIETVVKVLKSKAVAVFDEEKVKNPQKQMRYKSSVNPRSFIHNKGGNKPARSLVELTDDKNIFKTLHMSFVWILKSCSNRLSETLLEGPPTEDSIIDMEKQEVTEEDFVLLYKVEGEPDIEQGQDAASDPSLDDSATYEIPKDDGSPKIKDIRHVVKLLGASSFQILAHHVVIGNQIIVRGNGTSLIHSFFEALTCLLPKGCYNTVPYSNMYAESYRCNFLGLNPNITIPPHVNSNEKFLLIDIYEPKSALPPDADPLQGYRFQMASSVSPDKLGLAPTMLPKMEYAIRNENLSMEVVELALICLKEEWMNKVKVLFKFTRAGGSRSDEDTKNLLKIVGAVDVDKALLTFWMRGLSCQYKEHIRSASKLHEGSIL